LLGLSGLVPNVADAQTGPPVTFWVAGKDLAAGSRQFYPVGNSRSIDASGFVPQILVASTTGRLTWVAEFPQTGTYYVWAHRYVPVQISMDEAPLVEGRTGALDGFRWAEWNRSPSERGVYVDVGMGSRRHFDIDVPGAYFDAILLTTDPAFDPTAPGFDPASLPPQVANPVLTSPRTYRSDAHLGALAGPYGYVVSSLPPYEESIDDFVPTAAQILSLLHVRSAANQYVGFDVVVRALQSAPEFRATLSPLTGPAGSVIGSPELDVKAVKLMPRAMTRFGTTVNQLVPELLLRDDRVSVDPIVGVTGAQGGYGGGVAVSSLVGHRSRQLHLTIHVPESYPPGTYTGSLAFQVVGDPSRAFALPVQLQVDPIQLPKVDGFYGIFDRYSPSGPSAPGYTAAARYAAELADQARHGFGSPTLYDGFPALAVAHAAGMKDYALDLSRWPPADAQTSEIQPARAMGFKDYLYFTIDEPHTPQQLQVAIDASWQRKRDLGLPSVVTVSGAQHWNSGTYTSTDGAFTGTLADIVRYPILFLPNFFAEDQEPVMNASAKGSRENLVVDPRGGFPSAYFMTTYSDPLMLRAFAGLYATRAGFLGVHPWAYNEASWDPTSTESFGVVYPDNFGNPISTLRWEAMRDGVDDVRYLQELDRVVALAEAQSPAPGSPLANALQGASSVRQQFFLSVKGRYIEFIQRLPPDRFEQGRQAMADAIVALRSLLNQPPVATDDAYTLNEDSALNVTGSGVLQNDSDPNHDALTVSLIQAPSHGTLTLNANGSFAYTPAANFNGTDSFRYRAADATTSSNVATVTLTVAPVNDAPVARAGADISVSCSSPAVTLNGAASSDVDGDPLSYAWSGPFGTASGVSPTVTFPIGRSTVTLTVSDGRASSQASVVVAVNVQVVGLLPPLGAVVPEGQPVPVPDRAYRQGSTLPLKLQLFCGARNLTLSDVAPPTIVRIVRTSAAIPVVVIDLDAGGSNDNGFVFRFADGLWIYNLSTQALIAGTYNIVFQMPDSTRYAAGFILR